MGSLPGIVIFTNSVLNVVGKSALAAKSHSENGHVEWPFSKKPLVATADGNAAMVTPESVAITMMATLAPLIPIPVTDMVPVAITILAAVATDANANTIFAHADANLRGRRQRHGQHRGTYQPKGKLFHFNLLSMFG